MNTLMYQLIHQLVEMSWLVLVTQLVKVSDDYCWFIMAHKGRINSLMEDQYE